LWIAVGFEGDGNADVQAIAGNEPTEDFKMV
jgi:hypothetical protein